LGAFLSKAAPDGSPIRLNTLFQDDSGDLDNELDEFFCFMTWNNLSEQTKKRIEA